MHGISQLSSSYFVPDSAKTAQPMHPWYRHVYCFGKLLQRALYAYLRMCLCMKTGFCGQSVYVSRRRSTVVSQRCFCHLQVTWPDDYVGFSLICSLNFMPMPFAAFSSPRVDLCYLQCYWVIELCDGMCLRAIFQSNQSVSIDVHSSRMYTKWL